MIGQFTNLANAFPNLIFAGSMALLASMVMMQGSIKAFNFKRPTIPAIFYFTFIIMIFLPSFLVYQDYPGPHRDSYIWSVISVMITVPLGIIFANRFFDFSYKKDTEAYFTKPPEEPDSFQGMYITHILMAGILLLLLGDYIYHAPVLPIVEFVKGSSDPMGLTMAREEAFKLLDPRWKGPNATLFFFAYLFLRTVLFPLIMLTALGYALFTKKLKWTILFGVVFAAGGFYAVSSLARAPISAIFMRIFFFLFLFYGAKLSKKTTVIFFGLILAFPLLVTTFANSTDRSLLDGLYAILIRLTYAPALDLYYYFEIFPTAHDYLHGHTLAKPFLQLVGASYFYIENFVAMYISPYGVKSAHSNAAFVSNLHADFGMWGVTMGAFFCGALMQTLHIQLARTRKTILNIAVYSFMIYAIWVLNFGSVTSVLLVNGVLPVLVAVAAMRICAFLIYKGVTLSAKPPLIEANNV